MNKPLLVFFLLFPCMASAEQGQILSYEISVEESSNFERLAPVGSEEKKTQQPREHEYLIEQMDVYGLSPKARFLALPRMVTIQSNVENDGSVDWKNIIALASQKYAVPESLIWAVIRVESNFLAHAVSDKGAVGAMQIMPETQKELGLADPTNAKDNVFAGTKYLKQQLDYFGGNLDFALAAYNAGAGNVLKYKGIPPFAETRNFVKSVRRFMNKN